MDQNTAVPFAEDVITRANADAVATPGKKKTPKAASMGRVKAAKKPAASARTYSESERSDMMASIAAKVSDTGCTFKDAIKQAGISEQTFYQWKKLVKSDGTTVAKPVQSTGKPAKPTAQVTRSSATEASAQSHTPSPTNVMDMFPDLVQLRQENLHLRRVLAEKLQSANDELRKLIASV